jgi:hypothetical protein
MTDRLSEIRARLCKRENCMVCADVEYLLGRVAELELAAQAVVDEAHWLTRKHKHLKFDIAIDALKAVLPPVNCVQPEANPAQLKSRGGE